jgi:hypothetical protein
MRKINLDVDTLKVESFDTAERGAEKRGTVRGNALTQYWEWTCQGESRDWEDSCGRSCSGPVDCICANLSDIDCL